MNPLTLLLRLPFLPLQGFLRLGELIAVQVEQELRDPARVRRELEEAQWQQARGEISEEDVSRIQERAISSLGVTTKTAPVTRAAEDRS
jgi:gas vesicle protein GvpG